MSDDWWLWVAAYTTVCCQILKKDHSVGNWFEVKELERMGNEREKIEGKKWENLIFFGVLFFGQFCNCSITVNIVYDFGVCCLFFILIDLCLIIVDTVFFLGLVPCLGSGIQVPLVQFCL